MVLIKSLSTMNVCESVSRHSLLGFRPTTCRGARGYNNIFCFYIILNTLTMSLRNVVMSLIFASNESSQF